MKRIQKLVYILLAFFLFFACEEVEREPVVQLGDVPVILTPSAGTTMEFEKLGAEENEVTFSWSEADFGFQSATSYTVQLDLAGGDFSEALSIATITDTTISLTQATMNTKLQGFGLPVSEATALEVRVTASVSEYVDPLTSVSVELTIALYASTFPSIYMIGAPIGGWDPSLAVEVVSTGEPYQYTTIAYFDNADGSNFRFFNKPDWNESLGGYDVFTTYPTDLLEPASADSDPNFNFIGTAGWYEMYVDTDAGTITMTAVDKPGMYLTGDATHGWIWDDPVTELAWVGYKIWEGDVAFTQGGAFRLFEQKDWGPTSYGYDVIVDYDTEYINVMAGHDDPNWEFLKPSGTYHVKVNLRETSIEITEL